MAVLDSPTRDTLRQSIANDIRAIPWTKPQLNAAMQAIEDVFGGAAIQQALSDALDAALSPSATPAQKRLLVKAWLRNRAERGN